MVSYAETASENLNKERLVSDDDFLDDAASFLYKRTDTEYNDPEEIYDAYMEHMRFQDTNEVTAVRDLMYAQESTDEDKAQFGRLMNTFDRMEGEDLWQEDGLNTKMVGDYIAGGFTAPSTWIGLLTGGAGKLGAMATQQAAKIGLRTVTGAVLKNAGSILTKDVAESVGKSALKGAAVEGAIGLGQGYAQEDARVETGAQEEFTGGKTLMTGAASALGGVLPASLAGLQQTVGFTGKGGARAALKLQHAGEAAEAKAKQVAKKAVAKQFKNSSPTKVAKVKADILADLAGIRDSLASVNAAQLKDPLNKAIAEKGRAIRKELSTTELLIVDLPEETLDQITAAALELGSQLNIPKGKRITEAVQEALANEQISTEGVEATLKEFNLSMDEFSYIYLSELSDAGRKLNAASQIAKKRGSSTKELKAFESRQAQLNNLTNSIDSLFDMTGAGLTKAEATNAATEKAADGTVRKWLQELDRFRLASMTAQVATTVRNTAGGSFRVALDVADTLMENIYTQAGSVLTTGKLNREAMTNPLAVAKHLLFDQAEAKVVRGLFEKNMPLEAKRFYSQFFDTVDNVSSLGTQGPLTKIGTVLNSLNRISDNTFKQATFTGKLDQLIRVQRKGKKLEGGLAEVIAAGEFKSIDSDLIQKALDVSLDLVYQKYPKGKSSFHRLGQGVIKLHRDVPFLLSSVLPFPRFVINQLSTVVQHTPLLAIVANRATGKHSNLASAALDVESLAKQTSGWGMFMMGTELRAGQPEENAWYEFTTDGGKTVDLRATLGPLAPFIWAADLTVRNKKGLPNEGFGAGVKELAKMLGGPQFRAGTGLYAIDKLYDDLSSDAGLSLKTQRTLGRFVGDIANTFTLPLATVRDLVSLTDEEKRGLEETNETNFWDIVFARGSRSLPDFGEPNESNPRYSIDQAAPLTYIDPLERQLFGVSKRAAKNPLQQEMGRLRLDVYDVYKPSQFAYEDRLIRKNAAGAVSAELTAFINDNPMYRDSVEKGLHEETRNLLKKKIQSVVGEIREGVQAQILTEEAGNKGDAQEYSRYLYEKLDNDLKRGLAKRFNQQTGKSPEDNLQEMMISFYPYYKDALNQQVRVFNEGGFVDYAREFYEEEGIIPKQQVEEKDTSPSFEEILANGDPTEGMDAFQREVYEADNITPKRAKEILSVLPKFKNRVMSNADEKHAPQMYEAFDRYEKILKRTAMPRKGLMSSRK